MPRPIVALVGRPNTGKSTLFNRLIGRRKAIVDREPGLTRDRLYGVAEWRGRELTVVDTAGLQLSGDGSSASAVEAQTAAAIEEAQVIVFVLDIRSGLTPLDQDIAGMLRRSRRPVVVAANKADAPEEEPAATVFFRAGLGEPHPVSALHGRGSGDLLDALVTALPEHRAEAAEGWASFAILGRPNVGKSSLLNALVGEGRSLVDPRPGTTRDPVDSWLELPDGRRLRIADTAGMRREVKVKDPIEYFSLLRARQTLRRVDAAIVVIDGPDGVTGPDQRIAEEVVNAGRACVVALNKWDLVTTDEPDRRRLERTISEGLRFLPWARMFRTSAVRGRGLGGLVPAVCEAVESHRRRLPTPVLNRIVQEAQERRPHPRVRGRAVRILYAVQPEVAPPTIVVFATGRLEEAYLRYLEKQLRDHEPLTGTPVRLRVRQRSRG